MKSRDGPPVIGPTLRYDSIDNFWWLLMHELAHAMFHLDEDSPAFIDDLNLYGTNDHEWEADYLAQESLLPQRLGIHPSILTGRARYVQSNYRLLSQYVGTREMNHLFPD